MVVKLNELGAYNIPGRGLVVTTLTKGIEPDMLVEFHSKIYSVKSVQSEANREFVSVTIVPATETDIRRDSNNEARAVLEKLGFKSAESTLAPSPPVLPTGQPIPSMGQPISPDTAGFIFTPEMLSSIPGVNEMFAKLFQPDSASKIKQAQTQLLRVALALQDLDEQLQPVHDWISRQLAGIQSGGCNAMIFTLVMPKDGLQYFIDNDLPQVEALLKSLPQRAGVDWATLKIINSATVNK